MIKNTHFFVYKITDELNSLSNAAAEQSVQEAKLNEYTDEVNKLWDKLMSLEVLVVDQLEVRLFNFLIIKSIIE